MMKVLALSPVAGAAESAAAFWALTQWLRGKRTVKWKPTPKTVIADLRSKRAAVPAPGRQTRKSAVTRAAKI
jgi:hypothetical protein